MVSLTKADRISGLLQLMANQGWCEDGTPVSSMSLAPTNLSHFRAALLMAGELLKWELGFEDEHGAHPNDDALIVQTIARLNAELGRLQQSVDAPLFYLAESKRRNRKGSDPAVHRRIVMIGIFYRLYREQFTSDYACNRHICGLLAAAGVKFSVSSIANQYARFMSEFSWNEQAPEHVFARQADKSKDSQHVMRVYARTRETDLLIISEPLRRNLVEADLVEAAKHADLLLKQPSRPPRARQQKARKSKAARETRA